MDINRLIRIGNVSAVNPAAGTARVAFNATDRQVSYELPVLTRGSMNNKDYWMPDINEQVLCMFLPNTSGHGVCDGFILGTFYSTVDAPEEASVDVHALKLSDGSIIKHDRKTGNLTIEVTGNIDIKAAGNITINGSTINLN